MASISSSSTPVSNDYGGLVWTTGIDSYSLYTEGFSDAEWRSLTTMLNGKVIYQLTRLGRRPGTVDEVPQENRCENERILSLQPCLSKITSFVGRVITSFSAVPLSRALQGNESLRTLDLEFRSGGWDGSSGLEGRNALDELISSLPKLRDLKITFIGEAISLSSTISVICSVDKIATLHLTRLLLTVKDLEVIRDNLKRKECCLTDLHISFPENEKVLTMGHVEVLAEGLQVNHTVERFSFGGIRSEEKIDCLAKSIHTNRSTAVIHFEIAHGSGNHSTRLKRSVDLETLVARDILNSLKINVSLSEDAGLHLATRVQQCKRLREIALGDHNDKVAELFQTMLACGNPQRNRSLEWVRELLFCEVMTVMQRQKILQSEGLRLNQRVNNLRLWRWENVSLLIAWMRANKTHALRNSVLALLPQLLMMTTYDAQDSGFTVRQHSYNEDVAAANANKDKRTSDAFMNTQFFQNSLNQ